MTTASEFYNKLISDNPGLSKDIVKISRKGLMNIIDGAFKAAIKNDDSNKKKKPFKSSNVNDLKNIFGMFD